jgi:hypothetical protein
MVVKKRREREQEKRGVPAPGEDLLTESMVFCDFLIFLWFCNFPYFFVFFSLTGQPGTFELGILETSFEPSNLRANNPRLNCESNGQPFGTGDDGDFHAQL